ncbi:MAG: phosphomethylpyrimidine synthase ThiC [Deltaproteobacteria bacterium]|nr:phosphomethylpyrimidine synthase ThiC [Deltaproteobacteria bacterium]
MTTMEKAKKGEITPEIKEAAISEGISPERLRELVSSGLAVVPLNAKRKKIKAVPVGSGLKVKVNANIGTSRDRVNIDEELEKMNVAIAAGADAIMDLSTGGPIDDIRRLIVDRSHVPVGTVPIYQAACEAIKLGKSFVELSVDEILSGITKHAEDGVDFMTVHCGVTREALGKIREKGRLLDIVSRGGALMAEWMEFNGMENPLYEHFDMLLDVAQQYDVTLSLGDGLRPGCISDATDLAQIQELITLGELTLRAWDRNVQIIIEGPGHVPVNQIETNVRLQKSLCHGAPFYVLGPLPTDVAPGYDHITAAIGGTIAAMAGADFLCYVTPSEHLRLPTITDVKEGVIAARIAAHIADLGRKIPGAIEWDNQMAIARRNLEWEEQIRLSIDPEKAEELRGSSLPKDEKVCTMCADLCAIKTSQKALHGEAKEQKK